MASSRVVDYDTIIAVQTLKWAMYDTDLVLDLANHTDFDIHVSLLYDVGEEEPEDYTGIRVGYPADSDDRLGYLTPPQSPRKFQEETVDELVAEASHTYIGDIEVSPTGTDTGVKQALVLRNATGIAQVSVVDSPIMNEIGKVFDATEWIDRVPVITTIIRGQKQLPEQTLFWYFDQWDFIHKLYDDVYFDFEHYSIEGNVYIQYDSDSFDIKDCRLEFRGGLDPEYYELFGLGQNSASNKIRLSFQHNYGKKYGLYDIKQQGSIRFYLEVRNHEASHMNHDYRWIFLDYGFGDLSYMNDYVISDVSTYISSSIQAHPVGDSILKDTTGVIHNTYYDNIKSSVYLVLPHNATLFGNPIKVTTGTVTSTKSFDTVLQGNDLFYMPSYYTTNFGHPLYFPVGNVEVKPIPIDTTDFIKSDANYSIRTILTDVGQPIMATWDD